MSLNRAIFLLEKVVGKKVLLEAKMTNDEIYDKYYFDIKREDFDKILEADPTKKQDGSMGKFSKWLLDLYKSKKLKLEDLYKATEYLTLFSKYQQKIEKKDIKQYKSLPELFDAVKEFKENPEEHLSNSEKEREAKKGTERIWENNNWLILSPETEEAACYYGKGTQWCTAATESDNMFDDYNDEGPLYIIIGKKNGRKFQFHPASGQFMDETDNPIIEMSWKPLDEDDEVFSLLDDKELRDEIESILEFPLFSENEDSFEKFKEYFKNGIVFSGEDEDLNDVLERDLEEMVETFGIERVVEEFSKNNDISFIQTFFSQPIEEFYNPKIKQIVLEKGNAYAKYYYAMYVIEGRWKEAEPYIKQNKDAWDRYSDFVKKK